jgi:hypothetical protein
MVTSVFRVIHIIFLDCNEKNLVVHSICAVQFFSAPMVLDLTDLSSDSFISVLPCLISQVCFLSSFPPSLWSQFSCVFSFTTAGVLQCSFLLVC